VSKISVLGWYNHSNIGDESYKLSFPKLFPNCEFDFASTKSDTVILGGGDILNQAYVSQMLRLPTNVRKLAMSVSVNSHSPFSLLKKLDGLYVRDVKSIRLLESNNVPFTYMPDVSTCLEPRPTEGAKWLKQQYAENGLELYGKKIGIVFNAHLNSNGSDMLARDYLNLLKVIWDLAKLMDETPASFVLFPMSTGMPWDDRVTNAMLSSRCKFWKKNFVVYNPLGVQETLDLISSLDVVISSRLHSSIFCLASEVPFIDLTHHDKNRGFLETVGLEDFSVSYWHFDYEETKIKLNDMLSSDKYRERMKGIKANQLSQLESASQHVCFL